VQAYIAGIIKQGRIRRDDLGGHVVGLAEATYQGDDHVVGVHSQRCELVAKHLDANALHDDAHLALPMLVKLDKEVKRTH
jgi:hypothetical protein